MAFYISIDGDNIGDKIAIGYLENDEQKLKDINRELDRIVVKISNHLQQRGLEIIFVAADGVVGKGQSIDIDDFVQYIKDVGQPLFTFSAGIGDDLRMAFFALRYAKAIGKNKVVVGIDKGKYKVVGEDRDKL